MVAQALLLGLCYGRCLCFLVCLVVGWVVVVGCGVSACWVWRSFLVGDLGGLLL